MTEWRKLADAVGSATPDPDKSSASVMPIPAPVVANKPAPGRKGPAGLQPRQTFSRSNSGRPPQPDAGVSSQKSQAPRGMEFLPSKVAHQEFPMTTMMHRPSYSDLVKEAMEGTAAKLDINAELRRHIPMPEMETKTASARPQYLPEDHIEKCAAALEYLAKEAEGSTDLKPGHGPGALGVMEATSSEENYDTPDAGQATAKHVVPKSPAMQSSGVAKDPANAMATNDEMMHGEQPVDPMHNEKTSAVLAKNLARLGILKHAKELPPALKKHKIPAGTDLDGDGQTGDAKKVAFVQNLRRLGLHKQAEDALNKASISAGTTQMGATPPEGVSASEEGVPSEPSDVNAQKSMISSNQSAIDYTKRQAKADPKKDLGHVLDEPAQTASTDKVLNKTLDHTQQAGAKIASDLTRTAAAQALLSKLAEEAEKKKKDHEKKEKESTMGGGGLTTPAGQSGFSASSMM